MAKNTPDGAYTLYAVRPHVRFLAMGTGPICADAPGWGPRVIVPRAAAARLHCMTTSSAGPASAAGPTPVLGDVWASDQRGFGHARPSEVNAGGVSTGVVTDIRWDSWGGATASGTGTWTPGYISDGVPAPVRIIASRLGTCHGRPAYLAVTWYFRTKGETAAAAGDGFPNICDGP